MKILSCVPEQRHTFEDKLAWIDEQATKHKPDLFVTPQEYFGGVQSIFFDSDEPLHYAEHTVIDACRALVDKHNMGLAVGALVQDEQTGLIRERIYVIDPEKGVTGSFDKMMLPAYDHINAKGRTRVTPESDFMRRSKVAEVKGARVSILFCWEVYSNFIWHAISRAQPDIVLSMIKFGVSGWPQKAKDEHGQSIVTGFGFGGDGGWIERLRMAARYDVAAPVVCSTNSWNLPKRARPLAGTIYPFEDHEDTLAYPPKGSRGDIEETVVVDDINPLEFRYIRQNKFAYNKHVGDWPSGAVRARTMMWKIKRMERKFLELRDTIDIKGNDAAPAQLGLFDE